MTTDLKPIPIDESGYIDYQGKIFILQYGDSEISADYQYDGTRCRQGCWYGFVFKEFNSALSALKYFNKGFWYKKTSWAIPGYTYFDENDLLYKKYFEKCKNITENFFKELQIEATKNSVKDSEILSSILNEVNTQTKCQFQLAYPDNFYGDNWYEAHIPLLLNKSIYLLTWENCD